MRFRLRTLLIVMTIAGIYFAWAAICRRHAVFHRHEADRVIADAASAGGSMSPRELKMWTELLGSDRAQSYTNPALGQLAMNSDIRSILEQATYHQATANFYQHAAWRPWELLISKPPQLGARSMFRFTIRDMLWLTVVVAVATCWFADRRTVGKLRSELRLEIEKAKADQTLANKELENWVKAMERLPPVSKTLLAYPPGPNDL